MAKVPSYLLENFPLVIVQMKTIHSVPPWRRTPPPVQLQESPTSPWVVQEPYRTFLLGVWQNEHCHPVGWELQASSSPSQRWGEQKPTFKVNLSTVWRFEWAFELASRATGQSGSSNNPGVFEKHLETVSSVLQRPFQLAFGAYATRHRGWWNGGVQACWWDHWLQRAVREQFLEFYDNGSII